VFAWAFYTAWGWAAAVVLVALLVLLEWLAVREAQLQTLALILSLPERDLVRLKKILSLAQRGVAVDMDEVRKIMQRGGDGEA
jgi:hypothetical protein